MAANFWIQQQFYTKLAWNRNKMSGMWHGDILTAYITGKLDSSSAKQSLCLFLFYRVFNPVDDFTIA